MTKDYKANSAVSQKPGGKSSLIGLYAYAFVLLVGFAIGLWNPFQHSGKPEKKTEQKVEDSSQTKSETETAAPKFDFYQLLPEMEVEIVEPADHPKEEVHDVPIESPSMDAPLLTKQVMKDTDKTESKVLRGPHHLQVGSFKTREEAEHMKVELAFSGFSSSIEKIDTEKGILHQVKLGPYSTTQDANKIGETLRKRGFVVARVSDG